MVAAVNSLGGKLKPLIYLSSQNNRPRVEDAQTARTSAFDVAKGIGICLMVYGHAWRGLERSGLADDTGFLSKIDYLIYTFHMPLFFIISGYLFDRRTLSRSPRAMLWNAVLFIAIPYFVYMNLGLVAKLVMAPYVNRPIDQITWTTFFLPREHYWFLWALFWAHVTGIAMRWIHPAVIMAIALGAGIARGFDGIVYGVFHFAAGAALARLSSDPVGMLRSWRFPAQAILLIVAVFTAVGSLLLHVPYLWAIPAAWTGTAAVLALADRFPLRLLALIGRESMAVFLLHIYFIAGMRIVLLKFDVTSLAAQLTIQTLIGVLIPALVVAQLRSWNLNRWVLIR